MSMVVNVALLLLCILGAAFFSGIETGLISIRRLRLRYLLKSGSTEAWILQSFLQKPDRLLGTTLVGTNLSIVIASVLATSTTVQLLGPWGEVTSSAVRQLLLRIDDD